MITVLGIIKNVTSFNAHNNPMKHVHYYLHFPIEGNGLRENDLNVINGSNTGRILLMLTGYHQKLYSVGSSVAGY